MVHVEATALSSPHTSPAMGKMKNSGICRRASGISLDQKGCFEVPVYGGYCIFSPRLYIRIKDIFSLFLNPSGEEAFERLWTRGGRILWFPLTKGSLLTP